MKTITTKNKKSRLANLVMIILLFIALCGLTGRAFATSYQWNGSASTSMSNASNWTPSGVPTKTDNLVIVSAGGRIPLLTLNDTCTNFTISSGEIDLGGHILVVTGTATCSAGTVSNGIFKPNGSTITCNGTTFTAQVYCVVGRITLSGSVFSDTSYFEHTTATSTYGNGGNTFSSKVTFLKNSSSGATFWSINNLNGNTFSGEAIFINNSSQNFYVSGVGTTAFNGNIKVGSTAAGGIDIGSTSGGTSTLASGKTITLDAGGFSNGTLLLRDFTQSGSTSQSFTLTSNAILNLINCTFNGAITFSSPSILIKNNVFNGNVTFTNSGSITSSSYGGNFFYGTTSVSNNGTALLRFANNANDEYFGNVTFTGNSTNAFSPSYVNTAIYHGNLTFNGGQVNFNSGTNKFTGTTANQEFIGTAARDFNDVVIDKSSGYVTLDTTLNINGTLTLTNGNIVSTASHLLVMKAGSGVSGASNSSFVSGPVKKIGNTSFILPTGKSSSYRSIEISAPSTATDAFTGEFFNSGQSLGTSADTSLYYLNQCHYWSLTKNSGSSTVTVKLKWDSTACPLKDSATVKVANWNGTKWKDLGNGGITGNRYVGSVVNSTTVATYGYFTLGYHLCFLTANAGSDNSICLTDSTTIGGSPTANNGTATYTYAWSPSTGLSSATTANPKASPSSTTDYIVTVSDVLGCSKKDTVAVTHHPLTYTWIGSSSASWTNPLNWSPAGTPTDCDSIVLVSGSHDPELSSITTVRSLTVNSGTLDLKTYTLTVSNIGAFNSGTINNGLLTMSGATTASFKGTQFGAKVNMSVGSVCLSGSTFNDTIVVTKTGSGNDTGKGGNTFNKPVYLTNSGSGNFILADSLTDTFNDSAKFIQSSSGYLYPSYTKNSTFTKGITVGGTSSITFGNNGGKVILSGSSFQTINKLASYIPTIKKLEINKSSSSCKLNTPLFISDSLKFLKGNITTDASDSLTMNAGSVVYGASDSGFVNGPLKKIGNTAFVFAIGKNNKFRSVAITAPSNSSDAYTAEYFDSGQTLGSTMDTTLNFISNCGYWNLTRVSGSSNITPKFSYLSADCDYSAIDTVHIAYWNGTKWIDKNKGVVDGDKRKTNADVSSFGYFVLAYKLATLYPITVSITSPSLAGACLNNIYSTTTSFSSLIAHQLTIQGFVATANGQPITYHNCSPQDSLALPIFIVLDSSSSNITNVQMDTLNNVWHCDVGVSSTTYLRYHVYVDCSSIPILPGNNLSFIQKWICSDPGYAYNLGSNHDSIITSNFKYPFIKELTDTNWGSYLNDTTLTFRYQNSSDTANIGFKFSVDDPTYCNKISTLSFEYSKSSNANSFLPLTMGTLTYVNLQPNEIIKIKWRVHVDSCVAPCSGNNVYFQWQCHLPPNSTGSFCTECQRLYSKIFEIKNADSTLVKVTRLLPSNVSYDFSCENDTANMVQWKYCITNPGIGALDSVIINLAGPFSTYNNPAFLTLIPDTSLTIQTICSQCTIDTIIMTPSTTSLCASYISNPLKDAHILIRDLQEEDSVIVRFKTFRCSEEDSVLLDVPKYYNQWMMGVQAKSICDEKATLIAPSAYFRSDIAGISGNSRSVYDVDQTLNFVPSVNHLAVAPGNTFGDSALLDVELKGVIHDSLDYQLLDCTQPSVCTLKGWLKAVVNFSKELHIPNPQTDVKIALIDTLHGGTIDWFADYENDSIPDSTCTPGNYYFYFNLADSAANTFLNFGHFEFLVQACCGGDSALGCCGGSPGPADYDVKFYLWPNPSGICDSLIIPSDATHQTFPSFSSTQGAWLPLSSISEEMFVHCPGCKHPGVIISQYDLKRITYGRQDSNNDHAADNNFIQITDTSAWYAGKKQFLTPHYSSFGDQLEEKLTAYFQDGDNDKGYTYQKMLDDTLVLHVLQLNKEISMALDTVNLQPTGFEFFIDTAVGTSLANCLDCNGYAINQSIFRTQLHLIVPAASMSIYMDTNKTFNRYFYTFQYEIDSLNQFTGNLFDTSFVQQDSLFPFTGFFPGQRYRMKTIYNECGNFKCGSDNSIDIDDVRKKSTIAVQMWLTDSMQSDNAYSNIDQAPNTRDTLKTLGWVLEPDSVDLTHALINHAFAAQYLFYCETFGGLHYFFTNELEDNYQMQNGVANCSRVLNLISRSIVGGNPSYKFDPYPFEYRPPMLFPNEYLITIPNGYHLDSSKFISTFNTAIKSPFNCPFNSGSFSLPADSLPDFVCLDQSHFPVSTSDTNSYVGDNIIDYTLLFYMTPDSCEIAEVIQKINPKSLNIIFGNASYTCASSASCSYTDTLKNSDTLRVFTIPNMHVSLDTIVTASLNHICSTVTISNPSTPYPVNYNYSNAFNVYLTIDTNNLSFTNWTFTYNNFSVPLQGNQLFPIKSVLKVDSTITGQLCASYVQCINDTDTLQLHLGWNCNGFPVTPFDGSGSCHDTVLNIQINNTAIGIKIDDKTTSDSTYTLCKPFYLNTQFTSLAEGGIYPDSIGLTPLPAGMQVLNVMLRNCKDNSAPIDSSVLSQGSDSLTWIVYGSNLSAVHILDSVLIDTTNVLCVSIKLLPGCGYPGNLLPDILFYGHKYCGDAIVDTSFIVGSGEGGDHRLLTGDVFPQNPLNPTICTGCFTVEKTVSPSTAQALIDTVTFNIIICGNNGSSQSILMNEYLPTDFTVLDSNYILNPTIIANSCDTFFVTGYFHTAGSCSDSSHINVVQVHAITGETFTDSACVEVLEPCADSVNVILVNDSASNHFPGFLNDTILIVGQFTVDTNFYFTNCLVIMGSGAQMLVLPGDTLIIATNTTVEGCVTMWRGIKVDSAAIYITDRATIRDAEYAIKLSNNSSYFLSSSDFEDCIIGVYMPDISGTSYSTTHGTVAGCNFGLYASAFKPNYAGQASHGAHPRAGIEVNKTVLTIGDANNQNSFFNMNNGIVGFNSNLRILNNYFEEIQKDAGYTRPFSGTAIVSMGNDTVHTYLRVFPLTSGGNTIFNCYKGVSSEYSNLIVSNVKIKGVYKGVITSKCRTGLHASVSGCNIEATFCGIEWSGNSGAAFMNASNDTIKINTGSGIGISVREAQATAPYSQYMMHNNIIYVDTAMAGISVTGVKHPSINCNEIRLRNNLTHESRGINLQACDLTQVLTNNIYGKHTNDKTFAFYSQFCPDSRIQCNRVDTTKYGFFFGGTALGTNFRGNSMGDHYTGLYLDSTAVIDQQPSNGQTPYSGNTWRDSSHYSSGYGAVNFNDSTITTLQQSLFSTNINFSIYNPVVPTSVVSPFYVNNQGWFDRQNSGSTDSCVGSGCSYSIPDTGTGTGGGSGSTNVRLAVANDEALTDELIPETKMIAKQQLYDRLKSDSALLASNDAYADFVEEKQTQSIGYLHEVKMALGVIGFLNSNDSLSVSESDSLISFYSDSIAYLDSLVSRDSSLNITIQRNTLIENINEQEDIIMEILSQVKQDNIDFITSAKSNNDAVSPDEIPDANEKFLNEMNIKLYEYGAESLLENYDAILALAMQCPYSGGTPVFRARVIISLFTDSVEYNDAENCSGGSGSRHTQQIKKPVVKDEVLIIPNPANDKVSVILKGSFEGICTVQLNDEVGRTVYSGNFNCEDKKHKINISNLAPGVYQARVLVDSNYIKTTKLVIAR